MALKLVNSLNVMKNSVFLLFTILIISCGPADDQTQIAGVLQSESYKLTPMDPSTAYEAAALTSMEYSDSTFRFTLNGGSYALGEQTPDAPQKNCANSAEGQHIHLIVDRNPYLAKYEPEFDHTIPDGEHYVLAFLSRSYHESIKTDKAFKAVKAVVQDGGFASSEPITEPMLFYSRPKGLYEGGDTKKVMLDYFLVNVDTSMYDVRAEINGESFNLSGWQPYYIEGLPAGESEIKLTLIDSDGNRVDNPMNGVARKIKLNPPPAENN